jgi:hypothetical protein
MHRTAPGSTAIPTKMLSSKLQAARSRLQAALATQKFFDTNHCRHYLPDNALRWSGETVFV